MREEKIVIIGEVREEKKRSIERAKSEKERILQEAIRNSSKSLGEKENEIKKLQEKKVIDFRDKARLIKEEKLTEGKAAVKQSKAKGEKNIAKAVELVIKKFEEAA
jgi:vacuolar-type H+-ATPase subunit H